MMINLSCLIEIQMSCQKMLDLKFVSDSTSISLSFVFVELIVTFCVFCCSLVRTLFSLFISSDSLLYR